MCFLNSDYNSFIVLVCVFLAILIIGFITYFFSNKQKIIRALTKLPIKQIGNLKINEFSRISGKALNIQAPLIAPFSNRKCVFYTMKIERKNNNEEGKSWKTLVKKEKIQEFLIEKNGDFVVVKPSQNPKNYISHLVIDKKVKSGTFNDPSPKFENLLNKFHIKSKGFLGFNKTLRYTEGIIEIGEKITVAGFPKWKNLKNEPIEGYNYSKIMAIESSAKQKLIITNLQNIKSKKKF
jgi:hypothetical protein